MRHPLSPYPYKRYWIATYADMGRFLSQDANEYDQLTEDADQANRTYQAMRDSHRATIYHHNYARDYDAPALYAIDIDGRNQVVQITRIDPEEN